MSDLISREALRKNVDETHLAIGWHRTLLYSIIDSEPAIDAVPTSSLIELRDWLVEHDAITLEGRRWLDNLIGGGDNGA